MIRVAVIGGSGSGKSTFARRLSAALGAPHVELDAINWQAEWRDLSGHDPEEFRRRVAAALAADAWVSDGNYGKVRDLVLARATHLVWLDYPRPLIMRRVIWRSLVRALTQAELWPGTGNRESFREWLRPDHPIRWSWSTHARRRREYSELVDEPALAQVQTFRVRRPRDLSRAELSLKVQATLRSRRSQPEAPA